LVTTCCANLTSELHTLWYEISSPVNSLLPYHLYKHAARDSILVFENMLTRAACLSLHTRCHCLTIFTNVLAWVTGHTSVTAFSYAAQCSDAWSTNAQRNFCSFPVVTLADNASCARTPRQQVRHMHTLLVSNASCVHTPQSGKFPVHTPHVINVSCARTLLISKFPPHRSQKILDRHPC